VFNDEKHTDVYKWDEMTEKEKQAEAQVAEVGEQTSKLSAKQQVQATAAEMAEQAAIPKDEAKSAENAENNDQQRRELERLYQQLEEKDRELAELKDKYLRVLADVENTRKRLRQLAEDNVRLEREKLLRDILPIVDNLERTVEAARGGGNGKPIVEGVELVLKSMKDFLRSYGVTQISAKGARFDPAFHEALDRVESAEHEPDTVVDELHSGYMIGDRVLRPARVIVAKASEARYQTPNGPDNSSQEGQRTGFGASKDDSDVEKS